MTITLPTPSAVEAAYDLIKPHIHTTPLLTNRTLNTLASTPQSPSALAGTKWEGQEPAKPKINFFFKTENLQRIGAFKVRGAFHALIRLIERVGEEEVQKRGVVTHSSGNHAQALSLASSTLNIPAYIVMPKISTPSKIAGTKSYGAEVLFSGSTSVEREAVVADVQQRTGAILVPPYDDYDIICGQGTVALEMEKQYSELIGASSGLSVHGTASSGKGPDAVITPVGGGGLNSGVATFFSDKSTKVFGAEPSFEGADDCARGLAAGSRIDSVKTLTIADGLRTPVGILNWEIISDKSKVAGVYSVTEEQIKAAMRLVLERMKVVVEPSAVVGVAVCLFNEEFRKRVEEEAGSEGWDVGIVFSGGNTTVEAIGKLFSS
ncbi:tryptophan synthase beta subunit-like PLP-dependent enzyme [Aspergillus venezuelensis]